MENLTNLFSAPFMSAAGWTVLHSLWLGAIVLLVVLFLQVLIARRNSSLKYFIAFGGQLGLFCIAVVTFFYYYYQPEQASLGEVFFMGGGEEANAAQIKLTQQIQLLLSQNAPVIAMIWLTGMTLLSLKMALGYRYIHQLKKNSWSIESKKIEILTKKIAERFEINIPFDIRSTKANITPLLTGIYRPFILLPLAVINSLEMDEVELILAHELAHLKRFDHIALLIQQMVEIVLYFNPAIWVLSKQLNTFREEACDDLVVSLKGHEMTYAKSLVKLQELNTQRARGQLALSALGHKNQLLNRIKRILKMENRSRFNLGRLSLVLLLPLGLLLASFYAKQEAKTNAAEVERLAPLNQEILFTSTDVFFSTDSIPVKESKSKIIEKIIKTENGTEIEAEFENNELQYLKIDGEKVDAITNEDYQDVIDDLKDELSAGNKKGENGSYFFEFDSDDERSIEDLKFHIDGDELGKNMEHLFENLDLNSNQLKDLFKHFNYSNDENGGVFELDGDQFFMWKGEEEDGNLKLKLGDGSTFLYLEDGAIKFGDGSTFGWKDDDGEMKLHFNGEDMDLELLNNDLKSLKEQYPEGLLELKSHLPNIIQGENSIIIRQNGDKDLIIDLNQLYDLEELEELRIEGEIEVKKHQKEMMKHQKELMKDSREQYRDAMNQHKDRMKDHGAELRDYTRDLKHKEEAMRRNSNSEHHREYKELLNLTQRYHPKALNQRIEQELKNDGFMSLDEGYTFKLKDNKLRINNKKQSQALYQKYKDIYEEYTGSKLHKGSTYTTRSINI